MEIMAAGVVLALVKIVKNMSQVKRLARGDVPKIKGKNQTHLPTKLAWEKSFQLFLIGLNSQSTSCCLFWYERSVHKRQTCMYTGQP